MIFWVFAVLSIPANAQAQEETLTNDTIIELTTLGFGEAVIIEKIQHSQHEFDTSLSGLKKLKEAGVSDGVIKAMVSARSASAKEEAAAETADPNDPLAVHEPGIYALIGAQGQTKMVQLVKMKEKRDRRELTVAEANVFGASQGTRSEDTKDFDFEKIRSGVYKVIVTTPLDVGEYCFFYAGATAAGGAGGKLFDFGVAPFAEVRVQRVSEEKTRPEETRRPKATDEKTLMPAKIIEVRKNYLMIETGQNHRLQAGAEVNISMPARGANTGLRAEVVEVDRRYAILKMKEPPAETAFVVGDELVMSLAE